MAIEGVCEDKRLRYQWLWTIDKVDCNPRSDRGVPMKEHDRLFIFFISDTEVCFHRRAAEGFSNDPGWDSVRGVYCATCETITGTVVDDCGDKTEFKISLTIDKKTGAGKIEGVHSYNPNAGSWTGRDH